MRLHEIVSDGDWKFAVELHPRVTLLTGLDEGRVPQMVELLEDIIHGHARDVDVLLELDGQPLLLDDWTHRANAQTASVEFVLRASDLELTQAEAPAASASMQRAVEQSTDAVAQAASARHRVREQLAQAKALADGLIETPLLDPGAIEAVSKALDAVRTAVGTERESAARELLNGLEEVLQEGPAAAAAAAPQWLVASAHQTLEEARLAAIKAEEAAKGHTISAADAADLEQAHRVVVDAEERVNHALSGPLARRRLNAANAVLQGVLERIGAPSYGAYLLRGVDVGVRTEAVLNLEEARRTLADAEAVWEELHGTGQPRQSQKELHWRAEAAALSGVADEQAEALAVVAERLRRLGDERGAARAALAETLGRHDIPLGPGDDPETAATRWLAGVEAPAPRAAGVAGAVGTAGVDELESLAAEADRRFDDALMAQQVAEAGLAAIGAYPDDGGPPRRDVEAYVRGRLAAVRSVGSVGALPFVMVDPFSALDDEQTSKVHSTVQRMSESVQVIYLTDSPDALAWAERVGQDHAAVRRFEAPMSRDPAA